jgi:ribosomal protein S18 acetylase RimI-like enzyme
VTHDPVDPAAISYAVCEPADVPEIVHLLARTFAANDPPARAAGLTPEDLVAYLERATRSAAVDGLTIVARVAASGQLAGTVLVVDGSTPPPQIDGLSPRFEPVMGIFGELDTQLGEVAPAEPGHQLYLLMLGVADAFARRGIAQELVRTALANGVSLGYREAATTATNQVSQHIFGKLGFARRAQVAYADYRHQGVAVFASIADAGGPMIMTRDVRAR